MTSVRAAALVAVALATAAGCGGGSNTVTARGVVRFSEEMHQGVVAEPVIDYPNGGTRVCAGTGHYSDLVEDDSIVIRDAHGKVVGIGQLEAGTTTFRDRSTGRTTHGAAPGRDGTLSCTMPFTVPGVDGGSDSYTVAIGDRVPLEHVERSELESMVLKPAG